MDDGLDASVTTPAADQPAGGSVGTVDLGVRVTTEGFSGPLDLLLYLVRRTELDIVDIPLVLIIDQFVATIGQWAELDLEVAGDFIAMAATLLEIKARLIAPPPEEPAAGGEDEGDAFDPRTDLINSLLAYRRFKEATQELAAREDGRRERLDRQLRETIPEDPEDEPTLELGAVDSHLLLRTCELLMARINGLGPRTVTVDDVPLGVHIDRIVDQVRTQGESTLGALIQAAPTMLVRVSTVMAVLEGTRQRFLESRQAEQYGDVGLRYRDEEERAQVGALPPEPPPEARRRRRPPLVTWTPPANAAAGEETPAEAVDDEPVESDDERFLRELDESCRLNAVLAASADLESAYTAFLTERHPELLPPAPVPAAPAAGSAPATTTEVDAATVTSAAPGAASVTRKPATALAEPPPVTNAPATPAPTEPPARDVGEVNAANPVPPAPIEVPAAALSADAAPAEIQPGAAVIDAPPAADAPCATATTAEAAPLHETPATDPVASAAAPGEAVDTADDSGTAPEPIAVPKPDDVASAVEQALPPTDLDQPVELVAAALAAPPPEATGTTDPVDATASEPRAMSPADTLLALAAPALAQDGAHATTATADGISSAPTSGTLFDLEQLAAAEADAPEALVAAPAIATGERTSPPAEVDRWSAQDDEARAWPVEAAAEALEARLAAGESDENENEEEAEARAPMPEEDGEFTASDDPASANAMLLRELEAAAEARRAAERALRLQAEITAAAVAAPEPQVEIERMQAADPGAAVEPAPMALTDHALAVAATSSAAAETTEAAEVAATASIAATPPAIVAPVELVDWEVEAESTAPPAAEEPAATAALGEPVHPTVPPAAAGPEAAVLPPTLTAETLAPSASPSATEHAPTRPASISEDAPLTAPTGAEVGSAAADEPTHEAAPAAIAALPATTSTQPEVPSADIQDAAPPAGSAGAIAATLPAADLPAPAPAESSAPVALDPVAHAAIADAGSVEAAATALAAAAAAAPPRPASRPSTPVSRAATETRLEPIVAADGPPPPPPDPGPPPGRRPQRPQTFPLSSAPTTILINQPNIPQRRPMPAPPLHRRPWFAATAGFALAGLAGWGAYEWLLWLPKDILEITQGPLPDQEVSGRATLRWNFNLDVVAPDQVGKPEAKPPTLTPPTAGTWTWTDRRSLSFTPDQPLVGGTPYTIALAKDQLRTSAGFRLAQDLRATVHTPALAVREARLVTYAEDGAATVEMLFNQPVDPATIAKRLVVEIPGGDGAAKATVTALDAAQAAVVRFAIAGMARPAIEKDSAPPTDLATLTGAAQLSAPAGGHITSHPGVTALLRLPGGTTGAGGPLGMTSEWTSALPLGATLALSDAWAQIPAAGDATVHLGLSGAGFPADALAKLIHITPALQVQVEAVPGGLVLHGGFTPGASYTVALDAVWPEHGGDPALALATLPAACTATLAIPQRPRALWLERVDGIGQVSVRGSRVASAALAVFPADAADDAEPLRREQVAFASAAPEEPARLHLDAQRLLDDLPTGAYEVRLLGDAGDSAADAAPALTIHLHLDAVALAPDAVAAGLGRWALARLRGEDDAGPALAIGRVEQK